MSKLIYSFVTILMLLLGIGIIMLYSTSGIFAEQQYSDALFFVKKQLIWIAIGGAGAIFTALFNYNNYRRFAKYLLLLGIVGLASVYIPGLGKTVGGAQRWINIAGFRFQPSESAKLILIIFFADYLTRLKELDVESVFRSFILPFGILSVFLGLIFLEPDFGTTVLIGSVIMLMFFAGGMKIRYLVSVVFAAVPFAWFAIFRVAYRRKRILAFLDPWQDPRGIGFQIIQSFTALGSGGLWGAGLGESQAKLFYLPEAHTDFIFSIIGEELGFVGCAFVVALFAGLVSIGFSIAMKINDTFGRLLVVGMVATIGLQAGLNVGVVSGALPTKGLPLPFISFGGSNLLMNMIAAGIIINVARVNYVRLQKEKIFRQKRRKSVRL